MLTLPPAPLLDNLRPSETTLAQQQNQNQQESLAAGGGSTAATSVIILPSNHNNFSRFAKPTLISFIERLIGRISAMQNEQGFLRTAVIGLSDRAIRETELKELVEKLKLQLAKVQEFVNSSRITELLQTSANLNSSQQSSAYKIAKINANEMSDLFSEILKAVESLKRDLADKLTNNEQICEKFDLKEEQYKNLLVELKETKTQLKNCQKLYKDHDANKKASDNNVGMLTEKSMTNSTQR